MSEEYTKEKEKEIILMLVEKEYKHYNDLKIMIDAVGVELQAFPVGTLNEVRDFLGHISDAVIKEGDAFEDRKENIERAHHHLRRIQLDCYKTLCICAHKEIKGFRKRYRFFDLSAVDDGNFIQRLDNKLDIAKEQEKHAKFLDANGKNSKKEAGKEFDGVYAEYEKAYNCYQEAIHYINEHKEGISRLTKNHLIRSIVSFVGCAIISGGIGYGIAELIDFLRGVC